MAAYPHQVFEYNSSVITWTTGGVIGATKTGLALVVADQVKDGNKIATDLTAAKAKAAKKVIELRELADSLHPKKARIQRATLRDLADKLASV